MKYYIINLGKINVKFVTKEYCLTFSLVLYPEQVKNDIEHASSLTICNVSHFNYIHL